MQATDESFAVDVTVFVFLFVDDGAFSKKCMLLLILYVVVHVMVSVAIDVIEAISIGFLPSDAEVGMESGSVRIF